MNFKVMAFSAIAASLSMGSAAFAATETFKFGCGDGVACDSASSSKSNFDSLSSSFSLTQGGLTVTATARWFEGFLAINNNTDRILTHADPQDGAKIGRYQGGAGVFSKPDGSHTVDGYFTNNDFIQLNFDQAVSASSFEFGYFNSYYDDFFYLYDVNGDGTLGIGDYISKYSDVVSPFTDIEDVESTVWGVMAYDANDSWKFKSITVEYETPPAVPLPAAGWMLFAGIGGLVAAGRRAKQRV